MDVYWNLARPRGSILHSPLATRAAGAALLGLLALGCSSDATGAPSDLSGAGQSGSGSGGGLGAGGALGAGGGFSTGGVIGSAGVSNSGGVSNANGGAASGGFFSGGGATGSGGTTSSGGTTGSGGMNTGPVNPIRYVFVVAMENHDGTSVYGSSSAPYINTDLTKTYASASNFVDPLPISVPSEPHYIWTEAGTNVFSDTTFTSDDDPSASNSTSSTEHLSTQIDAKSGLSWRAYQEGIDGTSGACPIHGSGFYAPKHDPFIFFQDVAGNPPSDTNSRCAEHHRPITALAQDLAQNKVASYNFITPNLCNDMHGQFGCPSVDLVRPGDDWLKANLPALISFSNANDGVIFVWWDEGEGSTIIPFLAIGPGVKPGHSSSVQLTHSSLLKSVERILGLPTLAAVASSNDFADLFLPGAFP
jgi:hypothetical protein